jgi:hypothetical protein
VVLTRLVSICIELAVNTGSIVAPYEADIVKKHESQKPELSKPTVLRTGLIQGMGP